MSGYIYSVRHDFKRKTRVINCLLPTPDDDIDF